jgi:surface polysaccharide O-acyltransferase-like enzyme
LTDRNRLDYLDNLKVFLVLLVIVHHAGQAYGATGGAWFYAYPGERVKALSNFFGFNASFFMGLFFFISGYFFPPSFDRHGARRFLGDKLRRFGLPLAFVSLLITPVLAYAKHLRGAGAVGFPDFYLRHWLTFAPGKELTDQAFNFGHLWFVEHLLVYAVLYAAIRTALPGRPPSPSASPAREVRLPAILLFAAALGSVTFLVRTVLGFPVDRWIFLFGFVQMEPAHLPQYLSLFTLGVLAYRHGFLASLTARGNILWFIPGGGIFALTVVQRYLAGDRSAFLLWEYREALLCTGVCIGLLALFRTCFNRTGPAARFLAENAYGAYIIHVAVVVALQYLFDPVPAGPLALFTAVSVLAIAGAFLGASLLRRIPGLKRVL